MTMPKRLTLLVYSLVLTLPLTAAEWSRPGTAERTDDGYLVRFELSDIPAGRFAGLEQASLSAAVQTAENGEAARAEVIPAGGGAAVAAAETIQPDKPLTFDVTPAVDRILFYGAPNDGFRLRLFASDGRPTDWELRDFTLSLTLDGEAPTPELRILAPAFHAVITAPKVEITARALPRDGRTIRRYDWFVDNRQLAQTPTEHFQLDTRLLEPGDHLLTVQAIDSGWNRSAAQLPIKVAGKAAP